MRAGVLEPSLAAEPAPLRRSSRCCAARVSAMGSGGACSGAAAVPCAPALAGPGRAGCGV